jgi:NADH-quinone oxidoreductase subunit M
MAKGRPILATLVLVLGMYTLAVPGSTNFAGEFSILAGVFDRGWGYAAVGVAAMVLAALYALRLISGILHERRGAAVRNESDDLVGGELILLVPLVAILVVLTAWPAGITERSFPSGQATTFIGSQGELGP